MAPPAPHRDMNEPYIVITCEEAFSQGSKQDPEHAEGMDPLFAPWGVQSSAKWADASAYGARQLRTLYPNHSVISFGNVDILGFPGAFVQPLAPSEIISQLFFYPLARMNGRSTGVLGESIRFGSFRVAWDKYDFIMYACRYPIGFGENVVQYLLHEGPEDHSRALLTAAGIWTNDLHDEIYVFDSGYWSKDHKLWLEVQKADWDDVILKDEFKKRLQKDVFGFFDSETLYKNLSIPWKVRNGKTISMKVIMKECDAKGYYPLYVKSFRSWKGEEGAMTDVFEKARQLSPCVIILEDLDSLINPNNRSFFLNQLDGLESNDGLLVIGTTNHLDRIDPALRDRPSRFDRKYDFEDPDAEERKLYVQYWQRKLHSNKSISFPDQLVDEVVKATDKFSFAYLKEAFVSTLVILAGYEDSDDKPTFGDALKAQIEVLRKQLGEKSDKVSNVHLETAPVASPTAPPNVPGRRPPDSRRRTTWEVDSRSNIDRVQMPGEMPSTSMSGNDMRHKALAAANLGRSFFF
ncbi:hypothetical protein EIP86_010138 [Pleurotus ostreatoroseus]|nr:hypothetical protein EIP86_010138 [Pleurotus ostreatoroseus]